MMPVKLVCLEIVIVSIATRSMLALIGEPPPIPDLVWGCVALAAGLIAVLMLVRDLLPAKPQPVRPPHVPLDRIGPFRREQVAARYAADRDRSINLN